MGLRDVVIIESDDAILVADKNRVQEVKKIVDQFMRAKAFRSRGPSAVFDPGGITMPLKMVNVSR